MLDFSGYAEQDYPYECPECKMRLQMKDCIGIGEYPTGGYRASMKPKQKLAMGFECPNCFTTICDWKPPISIGGGKPLILLSRM